MEWTERNTFVGFDWADDHHDVIVLSPSLPQSPAAHGPPLGQSQSGQVSVGGGVLPEKTRAGTEPRLRFAMPGAALVQNPLEDVADANNLRCGTSPTKPSETRELGDRFDDPETDLNHSSGNDQRREGRTPCEMLEEEAVHEKPKTPLANRENIWAGMLPPLRGEKSRGFGAKNWSASGATKHPWAGMRSLCFPGRCRRCSGLLSCRALSTDSHLQNTLGPSFVICNLQFTRSSRS